MKEIERLKATVEKQRKLLLSFGYPEKKPIPQADPNYWKAKYKKLMEEKIKIERMYGRLWEETKSIIKETGIEIGKHENLQGPTGEFLFPGNGDINEIVNDYKPFSHVF